VSKLAAQINGKLTGQVRAMDRDLKPANFYSVDVAVGTAGAYTQVTSGFAKQCKIGVTFEKYTWLYGEQEFGPALSDLKRAMIEEVFGEFRPIILEMRAAIYDRDDARMRKLLAELENQMFVDGV